MNLILEVELLSDALPGSGESEADIVDRDASFDDLGLPKILVKRIKGVLLNSAKDLADWDMLNNDIENIFGTEGDSKTIFTISSMNIENYQVLRDFLLYCHQIKDDHPKLSLIFNKHMVQKFFSYNRTQTSLMRVKLVSEKGSLRISRVLRKGLKFYLEVKIDVKDGEEESYIEDMEKICKITRNFGTSRTRGLGEIRIRKIDQQFKNNIEKKVVFENFNDEEYCEIILNLNNEEQLLVSNLINGHQTSEMYIRGGYILGALAWYFIKKKRMNNDFKKLFLSDNIIFTNFYPIVSKNIFYPVPYSIVREKGKERYFDLIYEPDLNIVLNENGGIQTEVVGGFSYINEGEMVKTILSTKIESHNRRPRDRKIGHPQKKEGLPVDITGTYFHYDVLEPNQKFQGKIIGKFNYLKSLLEILPQKMYINIGKSKTAQYGKCLLEVESIERYNHDMENKSFKKLIITLRSDMILMNEYGHIAPDINILKNEIENIFGISKGDTKIINSFIKFTKVGGFNSTWGLPKIQAQALAAGSVIVLERKDKQDFINKNTNKITFGLRTSEGYGQVDINKHGNCDIKVIDPKPKEKEDFHLSKNLDVLEEFIEFCLLDTLKSTLHNKALSFATDSKYEEMNISGSFLQRILIFIRSSDSIIDFNEKLKDLKEKALNNLNKITEDLYLVDKMEDKKKFKQVNEKSFEGFLNTLSKSQIDFELLEDGKLMNSPIPTYYARNITSLYIEYCKAFLTSLILKTRGARV